MPFPFSLFSFPFSLFPSFKATKILRKDAGKFFHVREMDAAGTVSATIETEPAHVIPHLSALAVKPVIASPFQPFCFFILFLFKKKKKKNNTFNIT